MDFGWVRGAQLAGVFNIAGDAVEEAKQILEQALADDADPLTGQRLPKAQRDHVQQYFSTVREGR